jgi:hypothetical protein
MSKMRKCTGKPAYSEDGTKEYCDYRNERGECKYSGYCDKKEFVTKEVDSKLSGEVWLREYSKFARLLEDVFDKNPNLDLDMLDLESCRVFTFKARNSLSARMIDDFRKKFPLLDEFKIEPCSHCTLRITLVFKKPSDEPGE